MHKKALIRNKLFYNIYLYFFFQKRVFGVSVGISCYLEVPGTVCSTPHETDSSLECPGLNCFKLEKTDALGLSNGSDSAFIFSSEILDGPGKNSYSCEILVFSNGFATTVQGLSLGDIPRKKKSVRIVINKYLI